MVVKETGRDRLKEGRVKWVGRREKDGLWERGSAKGGRDRLIKVKGERNRSWARICPLEVKAP